MALKTNIKKGDMLCSLHGTMIEVTRVTSRHVYYIYINRLYKNNGEQSISLEVIADSLERGTVFFVYTPILRELNE